MAAGYGRTISGVAGADDDDVGVDEVGGLGFNGCAKTGALQEQSGCRSWQSLVAWWLWIAFGAGRVVANGLAEEKEKVEFRIQNDGFVFRDGFLVIILPVQSGFLPSIRAVSLPLRRDEYGCVVGFCGCEKIVAEWFRRDCLSPVRAQ
ncbi:hypothetical protein CSPX01_02463 [Colletotrichum filicis]|nr:hypothetical protein CSPX01_02463 [Colletotrichum filicis]